MWPTPKLWFVFCPLADIKQVFFLCLFHLLYNQPLNWFLLALIRSACKGGLSLFTYATLIAFTSSLQFTFYPFFSTETEYGEVRICLVDFKDLFYLFHWVFKVKKMIFYIMPESSKHIYSQVLENRMFFRTNKHCVFIWTYKQYLKLSLKIFIRRTLTCLRLPNWFQLLTITEISVCSF